MGHTDTIYTCYQKFKLNWHPIFLFDKFDNPRNSMTYSKAKPRSADLHAYEK